MLLFYFYLGSVWLSAGFCYLFLYLHLFLDWAVYSLVREEKQKPFALKYPLLGKIRFCNLLVGYSCLNYSALFILSQFPLSTCRSFPTFLLSCLMVILLGLAKILHIFFYHGSVSWNLLSHRDQMSTLLEPEPELLQRTCFSWASFEANSLQANMMNW